MLYGEEPVPFENSQEILENLRIVSAVCCIFSFIVLVFLLSNLNSAIQKAYSLVEKRKLPLYKYTAMFCSIFLFDNLLIATVPWLDGIFPYADFLMDVSLLLVLIIYFKNWST